MVETACSEQKVSGLLLPRLAPRRCVRVPCRQGRLLRRQLDEAEAAKSQLHDEMAAVRSKKEAAELERHKLVLAHQTQAAAAHVQVGNLYRRRRRTNYRFRRCTDIMGLRHERFYSC